MLTKEQESGVDSAPPWMMNPALTLPVQQAQNNSDARQRTVPPLHGANHSVDCRYIDDIADTASA
jgi:squalene cyclase